MNGLVLLDKPEGMTSFFAASRLRQIYETKRIGHTGTLDPMATGVLPVFLGRATRLCSLMLESDKCYTAGVRLGTVTDSDDITGKIIKSEKYSISNEQLSEALHHFTGEYDQLPPMYSALKKNGVRLYDLARQGIEVERESRRVIINKLDLVCRESDTDFTVDVSCSKGTYIRSLVRDIGKFLGCGATMTSLRRTKTAELSIESCVTLEQIEKDPEKYIIPADTAVQYLGRAEISGKQAKLFKNGGELFLDRVHLTGNTDLIRVYCNDEFIGIGINDTDAGLLRVKFIISE